MKSWKQIILSALLALFMIGTGVPTKAASGQERVAVTVSMQTENEEFITEETESVETEQFVETEPSAEAVEDDETADLDESSAEEELDCDQADILTGNCGTYTNKFGSNAKYSFDRSTGTLTITGKGAIGYAVNVYATGDDDDISDGGDDNDVGGTVVKRYNAFTSFSDSITSIEIKSGITTIPDNEFKNMPKLASITLPASLTAIGEYAFANCSKLKSVKIPKNVTSIGQYAFSGCSGMTSATILANITEIPYCSFAYCNSLKSVSISNGVTKIGYMAFKGCSSLTSVNIPDGVTTICTDAFKNCSSLKSMDIPTSVDFIDGGAFDGCSSLTSLNIPDGITELRSYTFHGCSSLTAIEIPESVTIIGEYAFSDCASLKSVALTGKVREINIYTFSGCCSLTSVTLPRSLLKIDDYAFYGCSSLRSVVIPGNVTEIGDDAFGGCRKLSDLTLEPYECSIASSAFPHFPSVVNTVKGISITWDKISGADSYLLCRDGENIATVSTDSELTYTDTAVDSGKFYTYTLEAKKSGKTIDRVEFNTEYLAYVRKSDMTVTNTTDGVRITWKEIEGAIHYEIYACASGETKPYLVTTVYDKKTLDYMDKKVHSGRYYTYYVYAVEGVFRGGCSGKSIRYLDPVMKDDMTLSNTTAGVKISWKAVTGEAGGDIYKTTYSRTGDIFEEWHFARGKDAQGYYIYRRTTDGTYTQIGKVTGVDTVTYTDSTAESGTSYVYAVRAYCGSYRGSYLGKGTTYIDPVMKDDMTVTNLSSGVKIGWKKIAGAEGYYILRRTASGTYEKIGTVSSGSTVTYTDKTAVNGTNYIYAVRAYKGKAMGSYLGKGTVRLTTPAVSSLTNVSTRKMTVKWGKNAKATGYQIRYSTSSSFPGTSTTTVTVTSASTVSKTISSLTKNKTYYVSVRSYKTLSSTKYYSGWSTTKSVKITK